MVIRLSVRRRLDLEALEGGITLQLFRIMASARLATPTGWSRVQHGVVDTGNPITLIPHRVWSGATVQFLTGSARSIHGLGSTPASALRGRLARVIVSLEDAEGASPPVDVAAYLLEDDRAPLLLGCQGILTRGVLRTDLAALEASLEF